MGAGEIPLPQASINPGIMQHPGPQQPDPLSQMLQYFMEAQQNTRANANSDAAIEQSKQATQIAQGHLKLAQEQEKTRQALIARDQQSQADQGKAAQLLLKGAQPAIEQHLAAHPEAVSQFMPQPQGGGSPLALGGAQGPAQTPIGAGTGLSAQPQAPVAPPPQTWHDVVAQMDPATAGAFATETLPKLLAVQATMQGKPATPVNIGGSETLFDPNRGYYDPRSGLPPSDSRAWKPSIERTIPADQLEEDRLNRELKVAQIGATNAYKDNAQAQSIGKQFDTRVKAIRDRASVLNQTMLTINSALSDPNPLNRKVLASTAVINYIQGADQKAQVRSQIVKYVNDNLDPSMKGWWNKIVDKKVSGVLPDYILKGMIAHIANLSALTQKEYSMQRDGELKRHPDIKSLPGFLPSPEEFFNNSSSPSPPSNDVLPPPP